MASGFSGFVVLGDTHHGILLTKDASDTPTNADDLPTFRVYSGEGYVTGSAGTVSFLDSGTITAGTATNPIVLTSASHGLTTGARITVASVGGLVGANGTHVITKISDNTFSLDGASGSGAYTSGGTWNLTGAYKYTVAATSGAGYEEGGNYAVLFRFAISSVQKGDVDVFGVT